MVNYGFGEWSLWKNKIKQRKKYFFLRNNFLKSRIIFLKSSKKSTKTKKNLAFLRLKKVKSLILWFLVKGLYFQNLQLEILKLKISQAFGLNSWENKFILQQSPKSLVDFGLWFLVVKGVVLHNYVYNLLWYEDNFFNLFSINVFLYFGVG